MQEPGAEIGIEPPQQVAPEGPKLAEPTPESNAEKTATRLKEVLRKRLKNIISPQSSTSQTKEDTSKDSQPTEEPAKDNQSNSQPPEDVSSPKNQEAIPEQEQKRIAKAKILQEILEEPNSFVEKLKFGDHQIHFFNEKGELMIIVIKKDSESSYSTFLQKDPNNPNELEPISISLNKKGEIETSMRITKESTDSSEPSSQPPQENQTQIDNQIEAEMVRLLITKEAVDVVFNSLPEEARKNIIAFIQGNRDRQTLVRTAESLGFFTVDMMEEALDITDEDRKKLMAKRANELTAIEKAKLKIIKLGGDSPDDKIIILEPENITKILELLDIKKTDTLGNLISTIKNNLPNNLEPEIKKKLEENLDTLVENLGESTNQTLSNALANHYQKIESGEDINPSQEHIIQAIDALLGNSEIFKNLNYERREKVLQTVKNTSMITAIILIMMIWQSSKESNQNPAAGMMGQH